MAVQLTINSDANIQGIEKAQRALEQLGMSGKSANQVFKNSGDLEAYKAALQRAYNSAALFNGQMKASQQAITMANAAFKQAQQYLGADPSRTFRFIDEQGIEQQTRDLGIIQKQIFSFLKDVEADTDTFRKAATKNLRSTFSMEGVEKGAEAVRMFGTELEAVEFKMSKIREQGLNLSSIHGDPKEIQKLSEEYQKLTIEHDKLSKAANGTGERIKNLIKNFVSAQLIVWAIRKVFQLLTQGLKDASNAAAEAEQVFGRFDAVFEGLDRANAAVQNMVDNFGVAKSSAADILSTIGNTALGFGASAMEAAQFSETIASALSDIMAFRDVTGTLSDFAQRFMSGASGNVENFRSIGSVVRESMVDLELQKNGWENLTGQSLEWAKVQARVNIVLEQQKKAMGATEREWDSMLSIQRRNQEATKELKENVGEAVNHFFKPMSEWILTLKENWNAAAKANENYNKGVYDPSGGTDFAKTPTARVLRNELIAFRNLQANAIASGAGGSFDITEFDQVRDFAKQYGATLRYTAEVATEIGLRIDQSIWSQIDAYDAYIKKLNDYKKAESDRIAASQAAADALRDFSAELGAMMNLGRSGGMPDITEFVGRDPASFVTPLERLLGFDGGEEAEIEAKVKKLSAMVEMLYNTSISGATEFIRTQASEMLAVVASALAEAQKAKKAMESASEYNKTKTGIEDEIASMQKRNELMALYGKDNEDIVNIKLQQWEAEKNAFELFKKRLHETGKAKQSYQEYLDLMKLISQQYGIQLGLAEDLAKKAKDAAADQAKASATDMFTAASRELSYLCPNGDAIKAQDEINDKVAEYKELLDKSGESEKSRNDKAKAFRKILEKINKTTEGNKANENKESATDMFTAATRELSYLGPNGEALKAQDDMNDKVKKYEDLLKSALVPEADRTRMVSAYKKVLEDIAKTEGENADKKTADEFTKSYQDRVDTLRQSYESLKLSSDLEKQYGSERAAIEQKHIEALQEAWRYMSEQVKLGMDATEANKMYLDSAKAITDEYELQLDLLEEQERVKRSEALESAAKSIAGVKGERALIGASDAQKTQARIDEQVYAFAEAMVKGNAEFSDVMSQTAEYRKQLEMQAAEEARQAVIDSITSAWEGTGDVKMIKGWVEAFAEGGWMEGIAKVATDLLTKFQSVNDLLSIVTKFIEYVAPAVDQFLAPLMPVLEILVSIIADLFLPVLQTLFPIVQSLSAALISFFAVVKTVTNAISWLIDTIETAAWNLTHWLDQRSYRDFSDETAEIWEDANEKVNKIMAMEIDTRLEFVGQLSDAQKGQLDAYNEMFKAGLLTLTEYTAMVGKNVYGKNFDNVDIASFASGGDFVTNGERIIRVGEAGPERVTITPLNSTKYANRGNTAISNASYSVVVNGANADPEEIAMSVRREFKRMERRGVKYA
jgi:hypothetical protein